MGRIVSVVLPALSPEGLALRVHSMVRGSERVLALTVAVTLYRPGGNGVAEAV